MKARLFLIYIILLLITSRTVFCQNDLSNAGKAEINAEPNLSGELFAPALSPDITTYFNREWLPGDIFLADGRVVRNKKIKYNGLLDELFWLEPESNKTIQLDKGAILQFHFLNFQGDTSVYFRRLKVKRDILNDSIEIFGQELYRGDLSLYILHNFYFARRETVPMGKKYILKDIYLEEPVYYIRLLNKKAVGFKSFSRKNIYAFLPGKKEQIKKYFKEHRQGNINTNPEIIKLVQFLGTIIEQ
jgi:hypothetical protein